MILAIGMTLVVSASAGTDISVGAIMAVSAAVCCNILTGGERAATEYASPLILGFLAALVIGMLIGSFNGFLVAKIKNPANGSDPDYVHGRPRNRAADHRWTDYICTCGELQDPGKLPPHVPVPTPFIVAMLMVLLTALLLRKTALGLYIQSVGINAKASSW